MKSKLIAVVVWGLLVAGPAAPAQDYTFRVMVTKGGNQVKTSGSTTWQPVKIGAKLYKGDELRVAENGYLGLVHASGKTKELKETGTYRVTELAAQLSAASKNITSKYADYVISKMSPEEREANRRKYASVTGAVSRGEEDKIDVFLPKKGAVLNSRIIIRWEPVEGSDAYVVRITDLKEQTLKEAETTGPAYELDLEALNTKEEVVLVSVAVKGNSRISSEGAAIVLSKTGRNKTVKAELKELRASLEEESAINSIILAEFYEENNLLLDALTAYEHAIRQAPDVPFYREAYEEFLIRHRLKDLPE